MTHKLARLRVYVRETAVLDARALALGRIGMALLLLYDVAIRSGDVVAHYSDEGVEPRSEVGGPALPLFRLYFLSGSPEWATTLLVLAGVVAFALLVGYRTRVATAASWIMLAALQARNSSVLQGGDDLLVMFLLWGIFLPLGQCWSIDAALHPNKRSLTVHGAAPFAFYGQLFMLYFITGTLKLNSPHWRWGNGIYDALSADYFVTAFGLWLYRHYYVLKALSWGTLLLEAVGPLAFFIPPQRWKMRLGLVVSFLAFHIGISACMRIGMFSFVCMVGWLFLIPKTAFDRLGLGLQASVSDAANPAPAARWANTLVTAIFTYLVIAAMVADRWPEGAWRNALLKPARVFALQEHWGMFVKPRADSGFLVAAATLQSGIQVDLLRKGKPLQWKPPELVIDLFGNQRWRKMLMGLTSDKNKKRAGRYLTWLCRTENASRTGADKVARIELTYVKHTVGQRYARGPDERQTLLPMACESRER